MINNINDIVTIRKDLEINKEYKNSNNTVLYFTKDLVQYKGTKAIIRSIYDICNNNNTPVLTCYYLSDINDNKIYDAVFSEEMFEENRKYFENKSVLNKVTQTKLFRADSNILYFARKTKDVILPSKREEDSGYDIYAYFNEKELVIKPHETKMVPTGLYSCVSSNYVLIGRERGSTGTIGMKLGAGVIDSGYRGEIFIALTNTNTIPIIISKDITKVKKEDLCIYYPYKKAIAQLILLKIPKLSVKEITVEELQSIPSNRKNGALGSSNK